MSGKPKLIIIDGGQGSGKSTVSRILREQMTSTNLHSLGGVKNNDSNVSYTYHNAYLDMASKLAVANTGLNLIFERSHLSEKVYCNLGFKPYNFEKETALLNDELEVLTNYYDVFVLVLISDHDTYTERLKRDKPTYQNAEFCVDNSLKQQEQYVHELRVIKNVTSNVNIKVVYTNNDISAKEIAENIMEYVGVK